MSSCICTEVYLVLAVAVAYAVAVACQHVCIATLLPPCMPAAGRKAGTSGCGPAVRCGAVWLCCAVRCGPAVQLCHGSVGSVCRTVAVQESDSGANNDVWFALRCRYPPLRVFLLHESGRSPPGSTRPNKAGGTRQHSQRFLHCRSHACDHTTAAKPFICSMLPGPDAAAKGLPGLLSGNRLGCRAM